MMKSGPKKMKCSVTNWMNQGLNTTDWIEYKKCKFFVGISRRCEKVRITNVIQFIPDEMIQQIDKTQTQWSMLKNGLYQFCTLLYTFGCRMLLKRNYSDEIILFEWTNCGADEETIDVFVRNSRMDKHRLFSLLNS